jgi:hypothetical protein
MIGPAGGLPRGCTNEPAEPEAARSPIGSRLTYAAFVDDQQEGPRTAGGQPERVAR